MTLNVRMQCPKFAFIFYSYFKDESLQSLQETKYFNGLRLEVVARFALKVQNLIITIKPDKTFFRNYSDFKKFLTGGITMKRVA